MTICGGCTTLNATVQGSVGTATYSVSSIPYSPFPYSGGTPVLINIDDTWSPTVNLPFCFNFFGQNYNQFVIGSNAIITFDLTQANQYCQWPITNAIPANSTVSPVNCIMAPWHDIDPSVPVVGMPNSSADINWAVYGTAPCREMVISWDSVAMFSCNAMIASSQLVLHETTNIIDIYIREKPTCSSWNGGAAIEGIQDLTGTTAYVVPGRNFPTMWTVNNDGWRFMPTGPPNYTFAWLDQNNNVISNSLSFVVCPGQTTTYTAQVTNAGCNGPIVVTDPITVTVSAGNLSVAMASTSTVCNNSTGTATATPTGTGPFTYSWAPGGQTTQSINGLAAGTYSCTVTDANGCVVTQTVVVATSSSTTVTLTSLTNIVCNGNNTGSATVSANGGQGPYTYSWSPSGGTSATATGLAAGTYTVTVTDANNCTSTQTVTVTQPPPLTLAMATTNITCFGMGNGTSTATGGGGTGPYSYVWQPGGQTTTTISNLAVGNYTCTLTDANGCVTTQTTSITQPALFTCGVNAVNTSCGLNNGSATTFVNGGTGPFNYAWSPGGGNSQTDSLLAPGTYTVNIVDANGCTTMDSVTILSSVPAVASFSGIDTTGCQPICATFTNTSPAATSCLWDFGDGFTSTNCNETHCYTVPGTYSVQLTITDGSGCTAIATHTNMVDVYPQPVASFIADPDTASEFDPVIYFQSTSTNTTNWLWVFGDSAQGTSTMANTNYTFPDTGSFAVTLYVSNSYGCIDSVTETIFIAREFTFYAPNAFTPNGDGKNDLFLPVGTAIDENSFHMYIFDRWGNLIYETRDFNKGWDGRANGGVDIAQIDTYVWKVSFNDLLRKNHKYMGHVSLIR